MISIKCCNHQRFLIIDISQVLHSIRSISLREQCPYLEFFWATFSRIRTEFGDLQSKYPYSFRMWEHPDQKTPNTCTFYTMLPF